MSIFHSQCIQYFYIIIDFIGDMMIEIVKEDFEENKRRYNKLFIKKRI